MTRLRLLLDSENHDWRKRDLFVWNSCASSMNNVPKDLITSAYIIWIFTDLMCSISSFPVVVSSVS